MEYIARKEGGIVSSRKKETNFLSLLPNKHKKVFSLNIFFLLKPAQYVEIALFRSSSAQTTRF